MKKKESTTDESIRLSKYLASLGVGSRREIERWMKDKKIRVNKTIADEMGLKINPEKDEIYLNGKRIQKKQSAKLYWMFHKPDKTLCSRKSEENKITIYQLDALAKNKLLLNPMGRLDYRTEGLLILTNDGELSHLLTHPSLELERKYHVLIPGELTTAQLKEIRESRLKIDDKPNPKVQIKFVHHQKIGLKKGSWYIVSVFEGRNRLVRKLFEACGFEVKRLIRVAFGPIEIDENLKPGTYRQLNSKEVKSLKKLVGLSKEESFK